LDGKPVEQYSLFHSNPELLSQRPLLTSGKKTSRRNYSTTLLFGFQAFSLGQAMPPASQNAGLKPLLQKVVRQNEQLQPDLTPLFFRIFFILIRFSVQNIEQPRH